MSAAPFGSAGILPISWVYIALMGADGLRDATATRDRSAPTTSPPGSTPHFPVLYTGAHGRVAHECILDLRPITKATGVTVDDVAKRLMDYGFHAPTMSFPVAGTLMVEPTESETLRELDRFCDGDDRHPRRDRPRRRRRVAARATARCATRRTPPRTCSATWDRPYTRELGAYPAAARCGPAKYFPPVSRIDAAYGDRNLVCSCEPLEAYARSLSASPSPRRRRWWVRFRAMADTPSAGFGDLVALFGTNPFSGITKSFQQFQRGAEQLMTTMDNFNATLEQLNEVAIRITRMLDLFEEPVRALHPAGHPHASRRPTTWSSG